MIRPPLQRRRPGRGTVALGFALLALSLAAETAAAQILREPVPDRVVVLTFDDAVVSHATHVAPLLKEYGFGGSFYVVEFGQPPFSDKSLYMSWEQIRMLNQLGFEVGNHTAKHVHVPGQGRDELVASLEYIEERGVALGIPKPLTFAYPAYRTAPEALEALRAKGYIFARVGGDRPYDPQRDHPLLIPSFTTLADNREEILAAFQQARDGRIVVLTVHGVPDTAHPWVDTPPALFAEYLRYLKEHDFTVLALRDLARYVDPEVAYRTIEPSFGPD